MARPPQPEALILPDGRRLEYFVWGPADGFPLVYIHGTPGAGSPARAALLARCAERKIKLITFSRAGYGGSTRHRGRRVVDVVPDVQALLAHLGAGECVVAGESGGGPHALACAARLPECLAALCICGVGPYGVEGLDFLAGKGESSIEEYQAALQGEEAIQTLCAAMRPSLLESSPEDFIRELATVLPEVDRKALLAHDDEDEGYELVQEVREALRLGADGWADDDLAFVRPWGFDIGGNGEGEGKEGEGEGEIRVPVSLWQGDADKMVPFAHGQWLAAHLPRDLVRAHLLPGEGHVSIRSHMGAMLDELLEAAGRR